MSDSNSYRKRASSPQHPDAERVGQHLVIDKTEWVPGEHPEPHRRSPGQSQYLERYIRCIRCGCEALSKRDLPDDCVLVGGRR